VVRGLCAQDVREETFGPVLTLHPADSDELAISSANGLETGLAGYVFGRDRRVATEVATRLAAGEVKINGSSLLDMSPESTQGFWGGSGIGAHGDTQLLDVFLGSRIVGSDPAGPPI
jgi:phenylacetaldehyde dehydrogenase